MKPGWYKINYDSLIDVSRFNGIIVHVKEHHIEKRDPKDCVFLSDLGVEGQNTENIFVEQEDLIYLGSGKFIEESKRIFENLDDTII